MASSCFSPRIQARRGPSARKLGRKESSKPPRRDLRAETFFFQADGSGGTSGLLISCNLVWDVGLISSVGVCVSLRERDWDLWRCAWVLYSAYSDY